MAETQQHVQAKAMMLFNAIGKVTNPQLIEDKTLSLSNSVSFNSDNREQFESALNHQISRLEDDVKQFKLEFAQINAVKDHMIVELRSEQAAFLEENLRLMEKFDNVDWQKIAKAEEIAKDFKETIETFINQF